MTISGNNPVILLTGATGYVGGRLLKTLESQGRCVRCLTRHASHLNHKIEADTQIVEADVLDRDSLDAAFAGVSVAYYLVHALGVSGRFEDAEQRGAVNFAAAAKQAGVKKIIYLGGLGHSDALSPHLSSRQQVGRILRDSGVPTIELRASIILGSGSASFEMIRSLVQKLPIMITPRWVRTLSQPIAIEDVIAYLVAAMELDIDKSTVFEIGGADRVSYLDLMREYARQRGLKRLVIPVPVLTPYLSSLWLGLVTPLYARVGRKLIDSLRNETIVEDNAAMTTFNIKPRGVKEAIARAIANEDREIAQTRWNDALSASGTPRHYGGVRFGSRIVDSRTLTVNHPPANAFAPIRRIGGERGWYFANTLWRIRGFIDLLCGGVGMRRGRRDPNALSPGDPVDFWRVEAIEPDRMLRLFAEMKLPGRAWLQFEVQPEGESRSSTIRQTAIFDPVGLSGLAYWYLLYPVHQIIFAGMLRGIGREVDQLASQSD